MASEQPAPAAGRWHDIELVKSGAWHGSPAFETTMCHAGPTDQAPSSTLAQGLVSPTCPGPLHRSAPCPASVQGLLCPVDSCSAKSSRRWPQVFLLECISCPCSTVPFKLQPLQVCLPAAQAQCSWQVCTAAAAQTSMLPTAMLRYRCTHACTCSPCQRRFAVAAHACTCQPDRLVAMQGSSRASGSLSTC